jgi:hypothetical protein
MAVKKPRWAGIRTLTATPESGQIVLGERSTLKDVYEGTYANCVAGLLARGTFGTGTRAGFVVTNCQVDSIKGARGKLVINWEPGGASATWPLPCADFSCETIELYPRTERHALFNDHSVGGSSADISLQMLALVYAAIHAATREAKLAAQQQVYNYSDTWQSDMGVVLLDKLRKGEETFYMAGMKYTWWDFSYTMPTLTLGGIIQAPAGPGSIPSGLPSNLSWLRLADGLQPVGVNGSMYKHTRTFMGGPTGHWDTDLYS